jgi:5-methylcytosine-specific restriction endonuclease McrA
MASVPVSEKLRVALRLRSKGRCESCGRVLEVADVHHRKQRSLGGKNDLSNLVRVCRHDHDRIHDDHSYEGGWLLHSWDDPLAVPVTMFDGVTLLDDQGHLLAT